MPPLFSDFGFGRTVRFCADGEGLPFLRDGWSTPEPWGVWSDGLFCQLLVPTNRFLPPRPIRLVFEVRASTSPGVPEQKATVVAGRSQLATWEWFGHPPSSDQNIRELVVSAGMVGPDLNLHFVIGMPASPAPDQVGVDRRQLGIGLVSLRAELA